MHTYIQKCTPCIFINRTNIESASCTTYAHLEELGSKPPKPAQVQKRIFDRRAVVGNIGVNRRRLASSVTPSRLRLPVG